MFKTMCNIPMEQANKFVLGCTLSYYGDIILKCYEVKLIPGYYVEVNHGI
jgi:hypothetical protein